MSASNVSSPGYFFIFMHLFSPSVCFHEGIAYLFAVFITGAHVKTCVAGAVFTTRALLFLSCWVKTSNATFDPFRGTEQIQSGHMSGFILFVFNNSSVIVAFRTMCC